MKRAMAMLLVLVMLGSATAMAVNREETTKKLEMLRENLKRENLSEEQIDEIIKTIHNLSNQLTEKEIDDIIELYTSSDKEYAYSKLSQEEQKKYREIYMRFPSLPAFAKESRENKTSILAYEVQKDGRMYTKEYRYLGVGGYVYPGRLQVSPSGTQHHYVTSHIGENVNGHSQWIEIGVARNAWDTRYMLFTVDSCDHSYFQKSTLYTSSGTEPWDHTISDGRYAFSPVKANRWLERYGSYYYWKFDTWID